jgi:hypothetical protein
VKGGLHPPAVEIGYHFDMLSVKPAQTGCQSQNPSLETPQGACSQGGVHGIIQSHDAPPSYHSYINSRPCHPGQPRPPLNFPAQHHALFELPSDFRQRHTSPTVSRPLTPSGFFRLLPPYGRFIAIETFYELFQSKLSS